MQTYARVIWNESVTCCASNSVESRHNRGEGILDYELTSVS